MPAPRSDQCAHNDPLSIIFRAAIFYSPRLLCWARQSQRGTPANSLIPCHVIWTWISSRQVMYWMSEWPYSGVQTPSISAIYMSGLCKILNLPEKATRFGQIKMLNLLSVKVYCHCAASLPLVTLTSQIPKIQRISPIEILILSICFVCKIHEYLHSWSLSTWMIW